MTLLRNSIIATIISIILLGNSFAQDKAKQQLYMEYMQIQMQLQSLQQKAFEDQALVKMRDEYTALVDSEMKKLGPEVAKLVDVKNEKISAFLAAQKAGDQAKMKSISLEAQTAVQNLAKYQKQVMGNKKITEKQQLLQDAVMKKMEELEPNFNNLIGRMEQIKAQLQGGK